MVELHFNCLKPDVALGEAIFIVYGLSQRELANLNTLKTVDHNG